MPRCLLIASSDTSDTDDYTEYPDEDTAKAAMVKAYESFIETYAPQVDDRFSGVRRDGNREPFLENLSPVHPVKGRMSHSYT